MPFGNFINTHTITRTKQIAPLTGTACLIAGINPYRKTIVSLGGALVRYLVRNSLWPKTIISDTNQWAIGIAIIVGIPYLYGTERK
jgi:hypothetical protein